MLILVGNFHPYHFLEDRHFEDFNLVETHLFALLGQLANRIPVEPATVNRRTSVQLDEVVVVLGCLRGASMPQDVFEPEVLEAGLADEVY